MTVHHGGKVGANARKLRKRSTSASTRIIAGKKLNEHKKRYH